MPSLQNIDAFKKSLRALGREPEIAAERGEMIADVKPPESVLGDDLSSLLDLPDEDDSAPVPAGPDGTMQEDVSVFAPEADEFQPEIDVSDAEAFDDFPGSGEISPIDTESVDDSAAVLSGLFDEKDASGSSDESFEDLFSFPEDPSFDRPATQDPDSPVRNEQTVDISSFDMPFESEADSSFEQKENEPAESVPSSDQDVMFPDEPPSPDELFSSDFTSSFGEDHTGDLFSSDESDVPARDEPSGGNSVSDPDTTLEADNVDFDDFSFSQENGTPDDPEIGDEFSLPEADTVVISPGSGAYAEGTDYGEMRNDPDENQEVDEFSIDEFNLGDIGQDYGVPESEAGNDVPVRDDIQIPSTEGILHAPTPEEEDREVRIQLTEEDFKRLQQTLASLPRNLKIIVEDLIGEDKIHGEPLRSLVAMLVHGESVYSIASFAGKLVGKKIPVPRGYEKKSVLELEAEQASFAYVFRHTILPVLLRLVGLTAVLCLAAFLGYRLIYRPVSAQILYSRGYDHLTENRFQPALEDFNKAVALQPMKGWFLRYAEGFIERNQYTAAQEKFDQLLERYPGDEKAVLSYAALETGKLANYEKAEKLLGILLDREMYHYKALLALGDNYMIWAEEDPGKLEEARRSYATLIQKYGSLDEVLFRMLGYFIRTDKYDEVKKLQTYFQADRRKKIDPSAYAELAGYLITKNDLGDVENILFRARDANEMIPEIHYQLARFFRETKEPGEERKALVNARSLFENGGTETRRELGMLIDTHVRMAEVLYALREYISSEQSYRKAISLYEDALARRLFQPRPEFGRMYAGLGDIFYYVSGELVRAGELYLKSREHGYDTPELSYKSGYVNYSTGKFETALKEFHKASAGYFNNRNLLYSMANALFQREDYFAAQGYYESLLAVLEHDRDGWPRERIFEDPEQHALVTFILKVYNNLGVTLLRLGTRTGSVGKSSEAMVYFTRSSEYYDNLSRNQDTLERSATKNLAFLNTRSVIYPQPNYEAQIYQEIPKDHTAAEF